MGREQYLILKECFRPGLPVQYARVEDLTWFPAMLTVAPFAAELEKSNWKRGATKFVLIAAALVISGNPRLSRLI